MDEALADLVSTFADPPTGLPRADYTRTKHSVEQLLVSRPAPSCGGLACAESMQDLATAANHLHIIGMAKGILVARTGCTPQEAFDRLRTVSQDENIKVYELAVRLIELTLEPPDEVPPDSR
jgi:hypothetical protein